MRAMILAAGRGARMGELTQHVPKPLIPVAGKSLIEHLIERLRAAGLCEIVINLDYRGEQIRTHLGNGDKLGVSVTYSQEPAGALDTGGGIAAALELLGSAPFAVVNSDIWTDFDFSELKIPTGDAHLILVPNPSHNPDGDFGLRAGLLTDGGEKWTFAGIGVYRPSLFRPNRLQRYALAPLLREAATFGRVSAEIFNGCWIDVGTAERLKMAKQYFAKSQSGHCAV